MREMRERTTKINQTLRRWRHQHTSVAFDIWRKAMLHTKEVLQRTFQHMANRTLSLVWRRWSEMVSEQKEQRAAAGRAVGRWRLRFVAQTFEAWATSVREDIAERGRKQTKAAAMWSNSAVAHAYNIWRAATSQMREAVNLQRRILARMLMGIVYDVFSEWARIVLDEVDRRATLLRKTAMKMAYASLVQTFEAWRELLKAAAVAREEREQLAKKMAGRMRNPFVWMCFEALRAHSARSVAIKQRAAYAIGPGRILHMVMRTWAHNVREQVRQAERDWVVALMEETLPQMIAKTLEAGIKPTLESKQNHLDGITARLASSTAAIEEEVARLRSEMEVAQARRMREQESVANRILRQWKERHISRAWGAWKEALAVSRAMLQRAGEHWRLLPLRQMVDTWVGYAAYLRHLQKVAQQIAGRLAHHLTSAVMSEWRAAVVKELGMRKAGTVRALSRWKSTTLSLVFIPWVEVTQRSLRVKALSRSALMRIQNQVVAGAFSAFATYVQDVVASRRELLHSAALRLTGQTRLFAFQAWREYTLERVEGRQLVYAKAVRRFFGRQLSVALEAWREFIEYKRMVLNRAAHYFNDGHLIASCFSKWRALWQHAADVKKTEWLLHDLKVVGGGWLVETLDQLLTTSLPETTQLHAALSRAMELGSDETGLESVVIHSAARADDLPEPIPQAPSLMVPHPPAAPRSTRAAAPERHMGLSKQQTSVHEHSSSSVRAGSPELIPPSESDAHVITTAPQHFVGAPASPEVPMFMRSDSPSGGGGELRSVALRALGGFLEAQQQQNDWAMQRALALHEEIKSSSNSETRRLGSDMHALRELQLEHAKLAYAEASKRQSDAVNLDARVIQLTSRVAEMDEQMTFVRDTLYSVLTSGQGGPIMAPPTKKKLNPIKSSTKATRDLSFDAVALP